MDPELMKQSEDASERALRLLSETQLACYKASERMSAAGFKGAAPILRAYREAAEACDKHRHVILAMLSNYRGK